MSEEKTDHVYTGIGARETPAPLLALMEKVGAFLAAEGYLLRSGGAEGASAAFEKGCDAAKGKKNIFLPWRGFNGNNSNMYNVTEKALSLAKNFNPAWVTLNDSAKKLQGRYAHAQLGDGLNRPSDFILCYTKEGKKKGGTGQALKVADQYSIPVFDLGEFEYDHALMKSKLLEFLQGFGVNTEKLAL